jgi:hypothetical protein
LRKPAMTPWNTTNINRDLSPSTAALTHMIATRSQHSDFRVKTAIGIIFALGAHSFADCKKCSSNLSYFSVFCCDNRCVLGQVSANRRDMAFAR